MKMYSITQDGRLNQKFYALMSAGKLINIIQRFDFNLNAVILEGVLYLEDEKKGA